MQSRLGPPCRSRIIGLGGLYIGFHHARLVMNAHLFGPGRGLNLEKLQFNSLRLENSWVTSSAARIIDGQLFLRLTHQLVLKQLKSDNYHPFRQLRHNHYMMKCPALVKLACQILLELSNCTSVTMGKSVRLGMGHVFPTSFTTTITRICTFTFPGQ
ncbi:uncharacterized protein F4812DRAFT_438488 [Daldinia caldariorum]|uniref:uncharacterized protein n=1 Tax=Daldinia caldariorum TaxID=326644 RepID=UPI002008074E|nr:uncharacterized protein F4812DRAFT_438488 [Daldinia caldariorum]KAI1465378.1 hypothetical protein F4812DRAFT_438488 [Daldinia caldariorum]